ncbi:aldehyde dehydrogenase [Terfezia boudieri ATCC MYA-4762]|uniref:Aldehyde dehydrogenase n=1 Tax=Terfezia boudieri ATCC MYA-4762 TaxID=1051890 RepID=A0A3N4L6Q4_9PEZI|nr:aldehyde dehydrogenase [Terfezia boudieri ATCC MYA-4762]
MPLADPSLAATLPQFQSTPLDQIPTIIDTARSAFHSGRTRPLEFRINQLQKLYYGLCDIEATAISAMSADLGRAHFETSFADINYTKSELISMIKNMKTWLADENVSEGIPWYLRWSHQTYLKKDPLGVVLLIGAWNYPWNLNLVPLFGAIAAGNTCILKPSEISPHSAATLEKLFEISGMDKECYRVIQGAVPETTLVLKQQFDKICYTGNGAVGKIVARAAAEFLTPVILELGGKNPVIIAPSANIPVAAKRIAWAKSLNSGQSCVAPDYLVIPRSLETAFITEFSKVLNSFYPTGLRNSPDYSRFVNDRHFNRVHEILKTTSGEVKIGGEIIDPKDRLMEMTLISLGHVSEGKWETDSLMQEEIFGPPLAYIVYDDNNLASAVDVVRKMSDTSLGAYVFAEKKAEQDLVLNNTRSGGFCVNEAFVNSIIAGLPFGGVGQSGTGKYRGKWSILSFVHLRSVVVNNGGWVDWLIGFRFPPFLESNYKVLKMAVPSPGFSRPKK